MSQAQPYELGGAPHLPPARSVGWVMRQVLYALIPAVIAHVWYFGPWIIAQMLIAISFALAFETLMLHWRQQPLRLYLSDCSAIVTAVLFCLCIPPLSPWWISAIGMLFAIVIAKHLYGGIGYNRFNPAMVGFVVVLISFPQQLTQWLPPQSLSTVDLSLGQGLWTILSGSLPAGLAWDSVSQATPLDLLRQGATQYMQINEIRRSPVFGDFGGLGWEWIANWYLLGGLWLLYRRVISWHVPVAALGTVIALTLPFYLLDPAAHPLPLQHIFSGGIMLGAFFIATDPVSGSSTPLGKVLFGAGVGVLMLVIRRWGTYPDGVAFAVLCMNMMAPLLDRYTRPRIYGHRD
ncbi:MAG: electron transport complex subunit RsxD [Wenzhouxiangellaceae bacterium]